MRTPKSLGAAHRGRGRLALIAAAAVITAVTACGGDDDSAEPAADEPAADEPAADVNAAPDGIVKFYYSAAGITWDPHRQPGTLYDSWLFAVYDTLTTFDPDGNVVPNLASSYEVAEDGMSLTLSLVEGVEFPDGTPFDSTAVKASLERAQDLEGSSAASSLEVVSSIETPDASTVVIGVSEGAAALPAILTGQPGMVLNPSQIDRADLDIDPTSAGMGRFVFVSHSPGDRTVFTANDSYWNPDAPPVGGLEIWESTEDSVRVNTVLTDESFDMTFARSMTQDEWRDSGFDIAEKVTTVTYTLHFNTAGDLADTRVRRAIAMAIDKPTLVDLAFPTGGCIATDQLYPAGVFGSNPNLDVGTIPYDPDGAQQLLEEAGATDLSFALETQARGAYVSLAEVIQQQLEQVGISTEITQSPFAESREKFIDGGTDMLVTIQFGSADPSQDFDLYALADSPWNPGGYVPEELPGLVADALASPEPDVRAELYSDATTLLVEEATPYLAICNGTTTIAYRSDQLGGLHVYPDGLYRWNTVYKVAD